MHDDNVRLDHVGFGTGATFLVGFGLDHRGEFRNLSGVVEVDLAELERGGSVGIDEVWKVGRSEDRH